MGPSLIQVLILLWKVPVCRAHVFENELAVDKLNFGVDSAQLLVFGVEVIGVLSAEAESFLFGQRDIDLGVLAVDQVKGVQTDGREFFIDSCYCELEGAHFDDHSHLEVFFIEDFDEGSRVGS